MRLSATDRIIREADEAEASDRSARGPQARSGAPIRRALATRESDDGLPHRIGTILDMDDDAGFDEGDTRVDFFRSAEALAKLRSYDTPSPLITAGQIAPQSVLPSPGADRGHLPLTPAPAFTPPPLGRPAGGPPPGRPKLAPLTGPADVPAAVRQIVAPAAEIATPNAFRPVALLPRPRVGRRLGVVIAAATAAAVVQSVGAWSAHTRIAARADEGAASSPAITAAVPYPTPLPVRPTITAIIQPSPPAQASAPPALAPSVVPSPPGVGDRSGGEAAPVAVKISATARMAGSGKAAPRRPHAAKVKKAPRPRHRSAARVPAPSSAHARGAPRLSGDPDDTLPIATD